ncbi:allophanate hydrolase [Clavibacter sepedonicus]|uniref:Allophanate hydrolase n=1 Tax=Clavibacter sepedonicus TaxID=31964 RepID=B0RGP4_CLASE|nr:MULTISPECIES: allophanate hydrolase [Clavibacter]MBD5380416.1 allophanate hydrolase [Clavibacter sp.]OQJ48039.1 allophanate hydrolase [Clavibacter sepedonicus]OQJ53594.1 allophanate hydrolase [Clavibacter sepedonicus]UUK66297.1 allophanate hydrolase [Clavibacter sepedonicus]CAQ02451.1 allophanate hydrolase [Clavibacter sepedonicus]
MTSSPTSAPLTPPAPPAGAPDPVGRVRAAYRRIVEADRPEVWITLRPEEEALAAAAAVERALADHGADALPLAGLVIAVKDNIDAAGFPTTAALPGSAYTPAESAPVVARLEAAGAVVVGKTNLDQLATGLVGTRSPYGEVRGAADPELVSGGSSSGSAVAVALGIVDAALGTDTAGSGRVPAAYNRLVGIKPTLGLLPARGVVPAAPSYDTVTVFARTLGLAERVAGVMAGVDDADPASRPWPADAPLSAAPVLHLAVPVDADLAPMSPEWRRAFDRTVALLADAGVQIVEVDIAPLLAAAALLYDGALVAERTQAVGHLLAGTPEGTDPSVARIIGSGSAKTAVELVADQQTLRRHRLDARRILAGVDALLLPTAPGHPSRAEVAADPIGVNSWVGTYTNFVNLLDLAAIAVPGPDADGRPFGVTLVGPAFSDAALVDAAGRLQRTIGTAGDDARIPTGSWGPAATPIAVFGAHMVGQPLNGQLTALGARLLGDAVTAPAYRLHALDTTPPKPGLVATDTGGASITGELWAIPSGRVADFVAQLARPMVVGKVALADGSEVLGFLCEPQAIAGAEDITERGSWRTHLGAGS